MNTSMYKSLQKRDNIVSLLSEVGEHVERTCGCERHFFSKSSSRFALILFFKPTTTISCLKHHQLRAYSLISMKNNPSTSQNQLIKYSVNPWTSAQAPASSSCSFSSFDPHSLPSFKPQTTSHRVIGLKDLSSDILLCIFKWLTSDVMAKVMRTCRRFLEIINPNRSLWRRLILPNTIDGWTAKSSLRMFHRKSQAQGLTEVSMTVKLKTDSEVDSLMKLLELSKDTLRFIHITCGSPVRRKALSSLCWKFTKAVDCRIVDYLKMNVQFVEGELQSKEQSKVVGGSPRLNTLWMFGDFTFIKARTSLFGNLASLSLEGFLTDSQWREILEIPSKSLKHLRMEIDMQSAVNPPLEFPKLQVLEFIPGYSSREEFPFWMILPSFSTILSNKNPKPYLPVSSRWVKNLKAIGRLENNYANLVELKVEIAKGLSISNAQVLKILVPILRQRFQNAEANVKLKGFVFRKLQRILIPSMLLKDELPFIAAYIAQMKELVEEVVDVDWAAKVIEIEI